MAMIARRRFISGLAASGAASFARIPLALPAEGPLETTAVRIVKSPAICIAPQYISEELLRAEGFTSRPASCTTMIRKL